MVVGMGCGRVSVLLEELELIGGCFLVSDVAEATTRVLVVESRDGE
jgi:hypothetical protein